MLPKINRIVSDKDIKSTYQSKYKLKGELFSLTTRRNSFQTHFKILTVVSKKISKKAHDRNKIKHRIAAAIAELTNETEANNQYSIIITANSKDILLTPYTTLKARLSNSLSKNLFATSKQ
jgi:ribonuclease P protein component